jgi:mevalonate kinase
MKKITVSAPGKLMLFGEHAVVDGHPCLVTAVNQRMYTTVEFLDEGNFELDAKEVEIRNYKKPISELGKGEMPDGVRFAEVAVKNFLNSIARGDKSIGIKVTTSSEFSSQVGFGSSSAVTVCVIKALSELLNKNINKKQIFDLSYKTVLEIQGKGSGFDIASAIYGGTLYFETGGKIISKLEINHLPLIVGYSGIKANTGSLIMHVDSRFSKNRKRLQEIYDEIEVIVEKAKLEIEDANWERFGKLMNKNQGLLSELGVSIEKLDNMINAALGAGAFGAKISGAGGGDCMIAVAPEDHIKSVEELITKAGGEIISIQTNAEGVRVENQIIKI